MEVKRDTRIGDFKKYASVSAPKSRGLSQCVRAFVTGGAICVLGQAIRDMWQKAAGLDEETAAMATAVSLVFLGVLFTGFGVYDVLGRFAGAGSIVPITGFANSVAAPAMEFRTEGLVLGVGAKMFLIAGPVLVYGTLSSCACGLIYWLFGVLT